jgi:hypothetical protein
MQHLVGLVTHTVATRPKRLSFELSRPYYGGEARRPNTSSCGRPSMMTLELQHAHRRASRELRKYRRARPVPTACAEVVRMDKRRLAIRGQFSFKGGNGSIQGVLPCFIIGETLCRCFSPDLPRLAHTLFRAHINHAEYVADLITSIIVPTQFLALDVRPTL